MHKVNEIGNRSIYAVRFLILTDSTPIRVLAAMKYLPSRQTDERLSVRHIELKEVGSNRHG